MITCREKEQALLNKLFRSKRAEFVAIYGRRRIGKTFLVHEFFQNKGIYLEITGSNKTPKKEQLKAFWKEFGTTFPTAAAKKPPLSWSDAFTCVLEALRLIDPAIKFIFFIDELPWFALRKSGFLAALDYAWNRHFSRMPNVLLIICGSAAHWMIKKVVNDKGGLHGRLSAQLRLEPFTLSDTEKFLAAQQEVHLKRKQMIELYMAMGGIAKYLLHATPGKSASQIINELCFTPNGLLFAEFPKLYASLFGSAGKHIAIVRALAKKQKGMSQHEILQAAGMSHGGTSTEILQELEESGFITSIPAFGKKFKEKQFRLADEYSLFYLTWIEEVQSHVLRNFDPEYWNKMARTPQWYNWAGHAFENVCLKHSGKIKEALQIGGVMTQESHWQYAASKNKEGAEIDLVIDRADQCINLCEIKFCNEEFQITKDYAQILERKKSVFQQSTETKKTLFLTIITPFGLRENEHSIGLVDQQLTLDALF
jgi:hypothetical protein